MESIDTSTEMLSGSVSAFVQANILLMLPLGHSIGGLWDIIRPLQYLSMIALVPIIYPANLYHFFFNMIDISSLDIFYGYTITEYLFEFKAG